MRRAFTIALILVSGTCAVGALPPVPEIPLDRVVIKLERTGCFGLCPAYSVTIRGDGRVEFSGKRDVDRIGSAHARVDKDRVFDLVGRFLAIRFMEMPPKFDDVDIVQRGRNGGIQLAKMVVADAPDVILRLELGDHQHSVLMRASIPVPKELEDLAQAVDDLAGTKKWVGSSAR